MLIGDSIYLICLRAGGANTPNASINIYCPQLPKQIKYILSPITRRRSKCWSWPKRDKRLGLVILLGVVCIGTTLPTPAQAQELLLNENCTISILNRTAQVQPDGSWRIDNVPANFGAVRARATCVEGGVTLSGQSSLFEVEAGIVNGFDAEIVLGAVDPIPVSLSVTTPISTLTSAGAPLCLDLELPE